MYCSLPFLAYMGMSKQASIIAHSASRVSLASMAAFYDDEEAKQLTREVCIVVVCVALILISLSGANGMSGVPR